MPGPISVAAALAQEETVAMDNHPTVRGWNARHEGMKACEDKLREVLRLIEQAHQLIHSANDCVAPFNGLVKHHTACNLLSSATGDLLYEHRHTVNTLLGYTNSTGPVAQEGPSNYI